MAILKIARMGHPVLGRRAEPVEDPTAPEIARLAASMVETMADAPGTGLAAPQVHVALRVVVFMVSPQRADNPEAPPGSPDGPVPLTVLVNPEIQMIDEPVSQDWEGCLSVPGLTGLVPRAERIRYRALDLKGARIEREARGFHARVVQHECDHLDGILYPQRMIDLSRLVFLEEFQRYRSELDIVADRKEEVL